MKFITAIMLFALTVSGSVFADQSATDCPMMRESTERNNPKANLGNVKPKATRQGNGKGTRQ